MGRVMWRINRWSVRLSTQPTGNSNVAAELIHNQTLRAECPLFIQDSDRPLQCHMKYLCTIQEEHAAVGTLS